MPRFYFSIYNGYKDIDDVGTELPDFDAVRLHALKTAGRVFAGETAVRPTTVEWRMEVTDDRRVPLFMLSFTDSSVPWVLREPEVKIDEPDDDLG